MLEKKNGKLVARPVNPSHERSSSIPRSQNIRTSFVGKPYFCFDLDRGRNLLRDPDLGRQRVDGMVIPDGGHVPFVVHICVRDSVGSGIPRPSREILRERSEGGGRKRGQHVGHGDPRTTDESTIRIGSLATIRVRMSNALTAGARAGRIRHCA